MRIVNKKKFVKMLIIMFGIVIGISFYFSNDSFSKGGVKTKTIYVSSGETLWTIAKDEQDNNLYYENKDIRDIVCEIRKINNIENTSNIQVGQKILLNTF